MKETDKIYPADKGEEELLHNVRHILQEARAKVIHHVNSTLVRAYWQVGKYIVEYEQQGTDRAGYGKAVINTLSRRLVAEFGNGFTATNLRYMRQFYQCYPKYHTLCDKLSWSHCRTLLKVSGDAARDFYLHECVKENWSVRQLDRQINTLFYDRLLASRDKKAVKEEISRTEPGRVEPKEIIRDPYILSFSVSRRESIFWKPIWSNCSSAACSASCSNSGKASPSSRDRSVSPSTTSISTSTWSFTITWPVVSF